jgi:hypothetical protein
MTISLYSINERATEYCTQMALSNPVKGWKPTGDKILLHLVPPAKPPTKYRIPESFRNGAIARGDCIKRVREQQRVALQRRPESVMERNSRVRPPFTEALRRSPETVRGCFDGGRKWNSPANRLPQRVGATTFKAPSEGRCFLSARLRSDSLYQPPSGSDLAGSGGQKTSSEAFADGMAPTGIRGVLTLAGQGLVYLKHSPTGITGV